MKNSRTSKIGRFLDWIIIRLSRSLNVDGVWIGIFSDKSNDEIFARVGEALELIKTYDPYRYKRIIKELDRILVGLTSGYAAVFVPKSRMCVIDPRHILSSSPESIASSIVHEATHGTLIRRNIGYSGELRYRVEKVCMRQERAFAQKIPHGEELRRSIERELAVAPEFWANEAVSERRRAGEIAMARYAGMPNWLLLALQNFRKLKAVGRH